MKLLSIELHISLIISHFVKTIKYHTWIHLMNTTMFIIYIYFVFHLEFFFFFICSVSPIPNKIIRAVKDFFRGAQTQWTTIKITERLSSGCLVIISITFYDYDYFLCLGIFDFVQRKNRLCLVYFFSFVLFFFSSKLFENCDDPEQITFPISRHNRCAY